MTELFMLLLLLTHQSKLKLETHVSLRPQGNLPEREDL